MREGCSFCTEYIGINDEKSEFYLTLDDEQLVIDVDIPITYGSVTGSGRFKIRFCPFCGRKLKDDKKKTVDLQDISRI